MIEWPDLPQLQTINLGDDSFDTTNSFEINNLPLLQSIHITERRFYWTSSLSLKGIVNNWLIEWIDLPLLQTIILDYEAFGYVQSVMFESNCISGLMNQIYPNFNPFNLVNMLLLVIGVRVESRWMGTTRIHWQWRVRMS